MTCKAGKQIVTYLKPLVSSCLIGCISFPLAVEKKSMLIGHAGQQYFWRLYCKYCIYSLSEGTKYQIKQTAKDENTTKFKIPCPGT